jgi:hypothetical protein
MKPMPFVLKSYALTSLLLCVFTIVNAQNIADDNFANAIRSVCPTCISSANNLLPPAAALTTLNVSRKSIGSLDGISGFTALQELNCSKNQLSELPLLPARLVKLNADNNEIGELGALPSSLTSISVFNNFITTIASFPSQLKQIEVGSNLLETLPTLPNTLQSLSCFQNGLMSLPTLPATLKDLYCHDNQLTALPALPTGLDYISCASNRLSSLPALPSGLSWLDCFDNLLLTLPALPNGLTYLNCSDNFITTLPLLPATLRALYCGSNRLTQLPVLSTTALKVIVMPLNNVVCVPQLPSTLELVVIDNDKIKCLPNIPTNLKTQTATLSYYPFVDAPTPVACSPTVTLNPTIAATVAAGSNVTFKAKATGGVMTVKWQRRGTNETDYKDIAGTTLNYVSNTESTYTTPRLAAADNGASYRAVFSSSCAGIATSSVASVAFPTCLSGSISSSSPVVCSGVNTGVLTLSEINGSVARWESSVNNFQTFTSINNNTNLHTFNNLTQNTQYRVLIQGGSCTSIYSAVYTQKTKRFDINIINVGNSKSKDISPTNSITAWPSPIKTVASPELANSSNTPAGRTVYAIEDNVAPRFWTVEATVCDATLQAQSVQFLLYNIDETTEATIISFNTIENAAPWFMFGNVQYRKLYTLNDPAYGFYSADGLYNQGFPQGNYNVKVVMRDAKGIEYGNNPSNTTRYEAGNILATQEYFFKIAPRGTNRIASIEATTNNNNVLASAYPNPTNGKLFVTINDTKNEPVAISLYDIMGRVALQRTVIPLTNSHAEELDLGNTNTGIYFIKINTNNRSQTLKITKN